MARGGQQYYAVAVGRKPGLYSNWDDATEQVDGLRCCKPEKFMDFESAKEFMRKQGVKDIRVFKRAFTERSNFKPDSSQSFREEFEALSQSHQTWTQADKRTARIEAIRDELIYHYLPEGIAAHQISDKSRIIVLTRNQELKIYQAMCRQARKTPHDTIPGCADELKKAPYVNIFDFINTFRTGQQVVTFDDRDAFVEYTKDGRKIDLEYAKRSEFLVHLLQKLDDRPRKVNPRPLREELHPNSMASKPQHEGFRTSDRNVTDNYTSNSRVSNRYTPGRHAPEHRGHDRSSKNLCKYDSRPDIQEPYPLPKRPEVSANEWMITTWTIAPVPPKNLLVTVSNAMLSQLNQPLIQPISSPVSAPNSSPPASDWTSTLSRSVTPQSDPLTPILSRCESAFDQTHIKLESLTSSPALPTVLQSELASFIDLIQDDAEIQTQLRQESSQTAFVESTQSTLTEDEIQFLLSDELDEPDLSSPVQDAYCTPPVSLGKRERATSPMVVIPAKRARINAA